MSIYIVASLLFFSLYCIDSVCCTLAFHDRQLLLSAFNSSLLLVCFFLSPLDNPVAECLREILTDLIFAENFDEFFKSQLADVKRICYFGSLAEFFRAYGGHYFCYVKDDLNEGNWNLQLPERFANAPTVIGQDGEAEEIKEG